jgi:hypothetical protein
LLLPQVAHSELGGAHQLVEGIDVVGEVLSHGGDYAAQVREVCENGGALGGVGCAGLLERDDARVHGGRGFLQRCSEALGLLSVGSGSLHGLAIEEQGSLARFFLLLLLEGTHLLLEVGRLRAHLLEGERGHAGACLIVLVCGWIRELPFEEDQKK